MRDDRLSAIREIRKLYSDLEYVAPEWAELDRDELEQAAEENMKRVEIVERMERAMTALHERRFGAVPQLTEDEIFACRDFNGALELVRAEQSSPFVLDPPKGLFAKKPKKEDYYALGQAIQLMKYYYQITAVRQRAYAQRFYGETVRKLDMFEYYRADMLENSPAYKGLYENYTKPDGKREHIYIGDIFENIDMPDEMADGTREYFDSVLNERGILAEGRFRIPCGYKADEPFVLFINHMYPVDHPQDAQKSKNLLHNFVYQVIHAMPAYSYQFIYMDPLNAGGSLGELQNLAYVRDGNAFWLHEALYNNEYVMFQPVTNKDDFRRQLQELTERTGKINTAIGDEPSVCIRNRDMFDEDGTWKDGAKIIPQQFVIIENTQEVLSSEACQQLETLINNSRRCGISLIMVSCRDRMKRLDEHEQRLMRNRGVDVIDWAPEGITISSANSLLGEKESGTFRYGFLPFSDPYKYPDYVAGIAKELKPNLKVETRFMKLFDIDRVWGSRDAAEGIRIPAGVNSRGQIVEISFGGVQNSGLLAGTTGCGKSSFLHTIINGVLTFYRPQDVELWLSDYKTVEFMRYTENTPANIKFVGTARTKEYSLALIDKIYEEFERRSYLIGAAGVTSIKDYREIKGRDSMPRLLIIIDEFHVMSNHIKDEPEYSDRFTGILREARSVGISMFLSDQTCGVGLNGLKEDARLQINNRMAMKTSIDEYNAVFNITNAKDVVPEIQQYEILLQRTQNRRNLNGLEEVSVFYEQSKTIFTPPEVRDIIAKKSMETYGTNEELQSISRDLRAPADWDSILQEAAAEPLRRGFGLFPGIPTDLKSFLRIRMLDNYNENLISIGADDILQSEVMVHLVEGLCRTDPKARILFIASENDDIFATAEGWIYDFCREHPDAELITEEEDICRCIAELADEVEAGRSRRQVERHVIAVWLGMPDICRDMEHFPEGRPESLKKKEGSSTAPGRRDHESLEAMFDSLFGPMATEQAAEAPDEEEVNESFLFNASEEIKGLLDEGPRRGIHSLVFNSAVNVSKRIRCARFESFNHKIAFRMSKDEAFDFLGNSKAIVTPDNEIIDEKTAVYYDGKTAVRFVPFIDERIE